MSQTTYTFETTVCQCWTTTCLYFNIACYRSRRTAKTIASEWNPRYYSPQCPSPKSPSGCISPGYSHFTRGLPFPENYIIYQRTPFARELLLPENYIMGS